LGPGRPRLRLRTHSGGDARESAPGAGTSPLRYDTISMRNIPPERVRLKEERLCPWDC